MSNTYISSLTLYPVKSMRGIKLQSATLDDMGIRWDRRWMVIDANSHYVTGRQQPKLLTIQPKLTEEGTLSLDFPDGTRLPVASAVPEKQRVPVTIWNDTVMAMPLDESCNQALSNFLEKDCRLVFIESDEIRQLDQEYANPGERTGFSDGFPLLLISEASLDDLNSRLAEPLPMQRFRPNIVVSDCPAYAEDGWREISINNLRFSVVKPCSRCVMTTVDQETGERAGKEPLQTLTKYRRQGNKVMFGQNLIHRSRGVIKIGDAVHSP
jgi:uncharacterized protein YcbX